MTVTSIDLPPDLIAKVKELTGLRTNRDAVTFALEEVVRRDRQLAALTWIHEHDPLADLSDPRIKTDARS